MAALWYNLPNYLSSIPLYIIPLSTAAEEETGFVLVTEEQLHPLKQTTTSAYLPSYSLLFSFFSFFIPPPLSLSLSGGQVTLNYSSVWNEKAHGYWISPLKWWPTLCFFFLLFFDFFFFLQLKRVKRGRSHCQGISKVNRLLYLVHIFTSFMVCGQGGGRRRDTEKYRGWRIKPRKTDESNRIFFKGVTVISVLFFPGRTCFSDHHIVGDLIA